MSHQTRSIQNGPLWNVPEWPPQGDCGGESLRRVASCCHILTRSICCLLFTFFDLATQIFMVAYTSHLSFYRVRSPLCTMCGVTPPLMNWQNIWKSILIFMYLPSSIFILHKYLAWIFYWQDRRRKIRILLQKGLIFKKNLIEEDLRCSVILNIESTAWDLYCDSFSSQFVHLSVFRDLLICLL